MTSILAMPSFTILSNECDETEDIPMRMSEKVSVNPISDDKGKMCQSKGRREGRVKLIWFCGASNEIISHGTLNSHERVNINKSENRGKDLSLV